MKVAVGHSLRVCEEGFLMELLMNGAQSARIQKQAPSGQWTRKWKRAWKVLFLVRKFLGFRSFKNGSYYLGLYGFGV